MTPRSALTFVNARFFVRNFDSKGQLLANAPHMPVHLGAMGESVRTVYTKPGR